MAKTRSEVKADNLKEQEKPIPVRATVYYYPTTLGHVAVLIDYMKRSESRFSESHYLSFGHGINFVGNTSTEKTKVLIQEETAIYQCKPIEITLTIPNSDIAPALAQAVDKFFKRSREKYSILWNNCADAVLMLLQEAKLATCPTPKVVTPNYVAKIAAKQQQANYLHAANQAKDDPEFRAKSILDALNAHILTLIIGKKEPEFIAHLQKLHKEIAEIFHDRDNFDSDNIDPLFKKSIDFFKQARTYGNSHSVLKTIQLLRECEEIFPKNAAFLEKQQNNSDKDHSKAAIYDVSARESYASLAEEHEEKVMSTAQMMASLNITQQTANEQLLKIISTGMQENAQDSLLSAPKAVHIEPPRVTEREIAHVQAEEHKTPLITVNHKL